MVTDMTRQQKSEELFRTGYNCSQAVIGAFCDDFDLDFDTAMKLSEAFGGGFGRQRLTCGAVSGMGMAVGMMLSHGSGEGDTRAKVYAAVQELSDEFKKEHGSIICGDLLGLNRDNKFDNPTPDARTEGYYKKRPCVECVKYAVGLIERKYFNSDIK